MEGYLFTNYKGIYRIVPNLDIDTNDVPRDEDGGVAEGFDDVYIPCGSNDQIYHVGGSTLEAYITSLTRGRRVINRLKELKIIVIPLEGDTELTFQFEASDITTITTLLKAQTKGADISPYSPKRLPKAKYKIKEDSDEWKAYKDTINKMPKGQTLFISIVIKEFLKEEMKKYIPENLNVKNDIRQKKMARLTKEYIHSMGLWSQFITYLNQRIKEKYN